MLEFDDETARRLEVMYTSPDAVRRRNEVLLHLALRPGERVLDVGCGPGFLAAELAAAVGPTGLVRGIDRSDSMIGMAHRRCAAQPWVTVQKSDAENLAFADAQFDVAVAVQVYEYVADVAGALRQVSRVLRPRGRVLVVDTDWDSIVWSSGDPQRMTRVLAAFDEHLTHPHLPRELGPLLSRAGFRLERCDALVQLNLTLGANGFSVGLLDLVHAFVAGRQGVTRAEADAWAEELRARDRRGEYFFSLNQYYFLASKL